MEYYWDDPDQEGVEDDAKVAYAVGFTGNITGQETVIVSGYYQDLSKVGQTTLDPSAIPIPAVTASEVVDRETLKAFVRGAKASCLAAMETLEFSQSLQLQDFLREEGSPWRYTIHWDSRSAFWCRTISRQAFTG